MRATRNPERLVILLIGQPYQREVERGARWEMAAPLPHVTATLKPISRP